MHANVVRSSGSTPNSIAVRSWPSAAESARPMMAPAAITRTALATTSRSTSSRRRAERAAHAEVAHPLLDRIREDAEHADHRQHQRERGKGHHHHRAEAVAAGRRPRDVLERHHVADADQLLLVDARDRGADRRRQRLGAPGRRPDDQEDVVRRDPAPSARRSARSPRLHRAGPSPAAPRRRSRARRLRLRRSGRPERDAAGRSAIGRCSASRTKASLTMQTGTLSARVARRRSRGRRRSARSSVEK